MTVENDVATARLQCCVQTVLWSYRNVTITNHNGVNGTC